MPNQLAHENSPYLLQHANNPVDWFPWGEEALQKARAEQKPIFLSIGYAACHWCHVMEHESFENEATAALMNGHFINIKVDREERPDLDSIYMAATVALTGSGGWPMSVFLTPDDLRPFYAGTYFPPEPRYNMPSFSSLLMGIANAWQNEREEIVRVGAQVAQHIVSANQATESSHPLTNALLNNAADHLVQSYDWGFGGWGQAPKFPHPMTVEFLLARATIPAADEKYLKTAAHALSSMARGGMYDVVGGGFARYSVDNIWRTPHFEKMLYDNAQLALAYLHAYLLTKNPDFRRVCEETLDFMLREMSHPAGGFYSSLDADSEGEEGKFYVWDQAEIESALGEDADFFKAAYAVTPGGNFEGKMILQRALDDGALAARFKLPVASVAAKLSDCHSRLLTVRSTRIRPGTDDKIITAWNAFALQAFAEAGRYLHRTDYTAAASKNANFLLENLYVGNRLLRSWRNGQAKHNAYLEDYASLALALVALYQTDPNLKWYSAALSMTDEMVAHYADPQGGFFDTRNDHETLLLRPKDTQDNATPSGSALAVHALLQLTAYGDRPDRRKTAEDMLTTMLEDAVRYPTSFSRWLSAADFALGPTYEIVIIGAFDDEQTHALWQTLRQTYRPRQVTALSNQSPLKGGPPLLNQRPLYRGQPTAYICQGFVCQQPVNDPNEFAKQLEQ